MFSLEGKVALVTGGSRGLGRAMVEGFAKAGADVVIASRNLESCQVAAAEIEERYGRQALPIAAHVGKWDTLDALVDAAYDHFGKVDVLVNNAGFSPRYDSLVGVSEELWDKVYGVCVKGPFRLSVLVAERMAAGDGGSIINISTTGAVDPQGWAVPYHSAKAALNAMTVALARSLGPKIRVNCIMPGAFQTDVTKQWNIEEFNESVKDVMAMQRIGQPEEIVGAALYFASNASSYTTGAILPVEGGSGAIPIP